MTLKLFELCHPAFDTKIKKLCSKEGHVGLNLPSIDLAQDPYLAEYQPSGS